MNPVTLSFAALFNRLLLANRVPAPKIPPMALLADFLPLPQLRHKLYSVEALKKFVGGGAK